MQEDKGNYIPKAVEGGYLKPTSLSSSSASIDQGIRIQTRAAGDGAFDSSEDPRYYKPIPEYEGIHRWDPDFEWTEKEERKLIRKVRWHHPLPILLFYEKC